jgi:hypothetical protein
MLSPSHNPKSAESATWNKEDTPNFERIEWHAEDNVDDV